VRQQQQQEVADTAVAFWQQQQQQLGLHLSMPLLAAACYQAVDVPC
jgi:hypothetical protein